MFRPFVEGMRELGYVEGHNLILDQTYVDEHYERFQTRAQELVERQVDLILASVPAAAAAARRVTHTIPIVFATSGDPVKLGLVESLSRPGGNLTGLSTLYPGIGTRAFGDAPRPGTRTVAGGYPGTRPTRMLPSH